MGKLIIEPETKYLIENSPEKFTKETINLYNKAINEVEQSDEYTLIGVDLVKKADGDYSVYTKMWFVDGKLTILENCSSKEVVVINDKPIRGKRALNKPYDDYAGDDMHNTLKLKGWDKPIPCWSTNESYAVKGGVILDEETCNEKVDS